MLPVLRTPTPPQLAPRRVLVATALGDNAASSLRVAAARATAWGAELAICHVGERDRRGVTRDSLDTVGEAAVGCSVFAEHGDVADGVARRAAAWEADLIVIGGCKQSAGRGHLWQSQVGWDIVQRAPCSVLITRHAPATGRMVVGTDLSPSTTPVVRAAALEQARTGATATLVHCAQPELSRGGGLDGLIRTVEPSLTSIARATGLRAHHRIVVGAPGPGLVAVACELAADLVVVGGGARRRGGIAERVARQACGAVLIVG